MDGKLLLLKETLLRRAKHAQGSDGASLKRTAQKKRSRRDSPLNAFFNVTVCAHDYRYWKKGISL